MLPKIVVHLSIGDAAIPEGPSSDFRQNKHQFQLETLQHETRLIEVADLKVRSVPAYAGISWCPYSAPRARVGRAQRLGFLRYPNPLATAAIEERWARAGACPRPTVVLLIAVAPNRQRNRALRGDASDTQG